MFLCCINEHFQNLGIHPLCEKQINILWFRMKLIMFPVGIRVNRAKKKCFLTFLALTLSCLPRYQISYTKILRKIK